MTTLSLAAACQRVSAGQPLSLTEMSSVIDAIMQGGCDEQLVGEFLLALRAKGETTEELAGAATAMRRHMTPVRSQRTTLVDTCGTGGVGSETFNISTTAAIVTAAAGVAVAKHGNRSVTSKSGSADVLARLGVDVDAPVPVLERCLDELGICFCFAPRMHPAMRHVMPIRKRLGVGTIFNLLGPLCNPAGAPFQVLGVGRPELRSRLAGALALLGTRRAVVVCGEDGLGEITLGGRTSVIEVTPHGQREFVWTPEDFGIARATSDLLKISGPEESATAVRGVLAGEVGPRRDIVVVNAAAALWVAGAGESLPDCVARATAAIDSGAARELLERWRQVAARREPSGA